MKKSSKIIIALLIVLIIAILGVGGYFIIKLNGEEKQNTNKAVVNEDSSNSAKITNSSDSNVKNETSEKKETTSTETTLLTTAELKEIETFLNKSENNGFVLTDNLYSKPSEINLNMAFMTNFWTGEENKITNTEINSYREKGGSGTTDMKKITTKQAEQFYLEKTGENLTDLKSRLNWIYLEKYDAYYTEAGDAWNIDIKCVGGTKTSHGKYVITIYTDGYDTVTLKKNGNNYVFISHERGANIDKNTNNSTTNNNNNNDATKTYTQEELEKMALNYYEKKTGYRPGNVASEVQSDGKLQIQLYDNLGDHNSTSDWYTIDMKTGKGENTLGETVDLTSVK